MTSYNVSYGHWREVSGLRAALTNIGVPTTNTSHHMETLPTLVTLCEGKPPITDGISSKRAVIRSFNFFPDRVADAFKRHGRSCDVIVYNDVTWATMAFEITRDSAGANTTQRCPWFMVIIMAIKYACLCCALPCSGNTITVTLTLSPTWLVFALFSWQWNTFGHNLKNEIFCLAICATMGHFY